MRCHVFNVQRVNKKGHKVITSPPFRYIHNYVYNKLQYFNAIVIRCYWKTNRMAYNIFSTISFLIQMHRYVRNATKLLRKTIYRSTIQNIRKIELYIFLFYNLI